MPPKPPAVADLVWIGDLKFATSFKRTSMTIDGSSEAGPSPVDALVGAVAGCMSADVVYTLMRGRHDLRALRAHLVADRAPDNPHRIVRIQLHFTVEGGVPKDDVDRAIRLSHEKYCSVWHSMRQDIEFIVSAEVTSVTV
jgi:putative redox protein